MRAELRWVSAPPHGPPSDFAGFLAVLIWPSLHCVWHHDGLPLLKTIPHQDDPCTVAIILTCSQEYWRSEVTQQLERSYPEIVTSWWDPHLLMRSHLLMRASPPGEILNSWWDPHLLMRSSPPDETLTSCWDPHLLMRSSPPDETLTSWCNPHLLMRSSPPDETLTSRWDPHLLLRSTPAGEILTSWWHPHLLMRS